MNKTELVISLVLIILGILVYIFPNLLAGYNTLPLEKKKKVDIKKIKKIVCIAFVSLGVLAILAHCLLSHFNPGIEYSILTVALPVFTIILMVIVNLPKFRIK